MGKNEKTFTVTIEKLIPGGKGLCRVDGKVVFVPFVLPGERVEIRITGEKKSYGEAELVALVDKSKDRVEPLCPLYGRCGGCNLQHMSYKAQVDAKKDFASNLLERNAGIGLSEIPLIESVPFGYRNRIQIHKNGSLQGFRERSGNRIVPVDSCPVVARGINDFLSGGGSLPTDGRYNIFGTGQWYSVESEGRDISVTILDRTVHFNSRLFFQSNLSLIPYLGEYLRERIEGGKLLDLYCGVGLMSSLVEDQVDEIEAVEMNRHVSPYIGRNLKGRFDFHPLSLEKWIDRKGRNNSPGTIIIDPPRTGLSRKVRSFLVESGAEKIFYISCDPATMARDLKDLLADKYVLEDFRLLDFYPQTSHMEAVALLKREK